MNNSIWHSKISGLNDPFEMFFNFDREALRQFDKSDIAAIIKKTNFLEVHRQDIEKCFFENDLSPIYKYIDDFWDDGFSAGLLREFQSCVATACFTKNYDSRLMWGYYGNGMKGICFAYNKEKLKNSDIEYSDVVYTPDPPKVNLYKHLLERIRGEPVTIDGGFALVKHSDWGSEEEVRSLKYLKGENVYAHQPGCAVTLKECCIDAVIIGERLAGDMRVFIENFAKQNHIEVLIAKADFTNYKIQIESK
ncbi:DUF2971 domain-containing protein [Lelliottia amnigena]